MDRSREADEARRASEPAIQTELLAARRRPYRLSPHVMAECPVICDLLGNGDPEVAHVEMCLKLLEIIEAQDDTIAIEAACYSLGLTSDANTHLARLEEFGTKHFIDQRQARRYSDRGIEQIARLISTHWTTPSVPEATVIVIGVPPNQIAVTVQLRCQRHIDLRQPRISVRRADNEELLPLDIKWKRTSDTDALWTEDEFEAPEILTVEHETTVRLLWRGETWPKFTVVLTGDIDAHMARAETLGEACVVVTTPQSATPTVEP